MSRRSGRTSSGRHRRLTPRRSPDDNVRGAAGWVLERTLASSAPVTNFLAGVLERFDARDQALVRELVLGSLRWLRLLDHVIAIASSRSFELIEAPLRSPLRVGAYQLLFHPGTPAYAIVDEAVEQSRALTHRGGASFVNAVLRRIARAREVESWPAREGDEATRLGVRWSHPDFLVRRWLSRFGSSATVDLLQANNRPKPLHLLAFRDRGGRELLAERLIDEGLEIEPSKLSPLGLVVRRGNPLGTEAFRRGDCYLQDEASQVSAWIPPPQPGERILDAAAAPGGKTFALLAREPELRIFCGDIGVGRIARLRENQSRLGRAVPMVAGDSATLPFSRPFQRVLLDLPCSGTGTLRKHPELKWRLSEAEMGRLSTQAGRLLAGCAPLVGVGGLLVAVTCSIEPDENEEVVAACASALPGLHPVELEAASVPAHAGQVEGPGRWRILPGEDHDGFTVTVLERRR